MNGFVYDEVWRCVTLRARRRLGAVIEAGERFFKFKLLIISHSAFFHHCLHSEDAPSASCDAGSRSERVVYKSIALVCSHVAFDPLAQVAFDSDPAAMPSPEHPVQLPIKFPLSLGALLKAD